MIFQMWLDLTDQLVVVDELLQQDPFIAPILHAKFKFEIEAARRMPVWRKSLGVTFALISQANAFHMCSICKVIQVRHAEILLRISWICVLSP